MAIAYDSSQSGDQATGTSYTSSYTVGAGSNRILLVCAGAGERNEGDIIASVTYGGDSLTKVETYTEQDSYGRGITFWYLVAPSTGANDLVLTHTGTGGLQYACASYTGVDQTNPIDTSGTFQINSSTCTRTLTTTTDNCWLADGCLVSRGQTAGANTTIRQNSNNQWFFDSNGDKTPAGSHSLVTTQSDSTWSAWITVAIAPVAASGTATSVKTINTLTFTQ